MNESVRIKRTIPEFYWVDRINELDSLLLYDNNGYYLTKDKLIEISNKLNNTINNYDEFKIEKYNESLKLDHQEQLRLHELENKNYQPKKAIDKIEKGYIYFITYDKKYYKIGKTKSLKDRMKVFSIEMPGPIEIYHTIKTNNMTITELLFHEKYANKRINGEWFNLEGKDLQYIKNGKYTKAIIESIKGSENNE